MESSAGGACPARCLPPALLRHARPHTPAACRPCPALPPTQVASGGQTLEEQALTDRLLKLLSGVEPAAPLCIAGALAQPPPVVGGEGSRLPLTW